MYYYLIKHRQYGNILLFRGKKLKKSSMKFDRAIVLKTPYVPDAETRLDEMNTDRYQILGKSRNREELIGIAALETL